MKKFNSVMWICTAIFILAVYPVTAANSDSSKSVIVDGKANCVLLDKAVKMEGGPGYSVFITFPGVLPTIGKGMPIYGAFVRGWDHSKQTVEYGAIYLKRKNNKNDRLNPGDAFRMKTNAATKGIRYHVFFVDDNIGDNTGGIRFKFNHRHEFYVDARKNVLDTSKAKKVELTRGEWQVFCVQCEPPPGPLKKKGIRLIGPQSEQHNEVLMRVHFHNGGEQYMLLNPSGLTDLITGYRGNLFVPEGGGTAYVFCVDDNIRDNSGEVKVVFNRRRF
jgi:hypothetical protein